MNNFFGLVERYRDFLPVEKNDTIISLDEGNTPLIKADNINKKYFADHNLKLYLKFEGLNPTGSFKDRGMTMAITNAFNNHSKAVICASTGNTSAAAAAYAARANMTCFILLPKGKIAMGKLAQAMMYGAITIQISGNFDDAMELVKELAKELPLTVVNSINPYRIQGQKTIAYEIVDSLSEAPDYHYLPVGNAGNISAHWIGYQEYLELKKCQKSPVMIGYQASGSAPFIKGEPVLEPETIATAIRIGNPQSWDFAHQVIKQSNGYFGEVSDQEILEAQYILAREEGVFCEPASAASFAGLLKDYKNNKLNKNSTIVCTLTGNGIKDPDIAIKSSQQRSTIESVDSSYNSVSHLLKKYINA